MFVFLDQPRSAAALAVLLAAVSGCTQAIPGPREAAPAPAADRQILTISGVRLTQGNAVDCPQVRTADGGIVPVSYLAPSIAIGDRVEVTGFMAVTTSCRGKVLYTEETRPPAK
jgi:hypothetical protein